MATVDDVYSLIRQLSGKIDSLEKRVALQSTEISKLTAQLRIEQLRGNDNGLD